MKIYTAAVAALSTKYSGNAGEMHIFLKGVSKRAQLFGWKAIVNIPTGAGADTKNLIDHYGLITLENIRAHAQPTRTLEIGTPRMHCRCMTFWNHR